MRRIKIAAFYRFVEFPDAETLKGPLLSLCEERGIKGTVLLASEGINGTIAGEPEDVDVILFFLRSNERLTDLEHKTSYANFIPFYRMKVCVKREIVSFGKTLNDAEKVGIYVEPERWNALINDPEVVVLDTRNAYEVDIGTFEGANDPEIESFRDFPEYVEKHLDPEKHKKIAMFCTGGIRCEKASAYMLKRGFEQVFHLKGGILKYLEETPAENSLWRGECFVFDNRVSVDHDLERGSYELCRSCRHPLSESDMNSANYEEGISCPYCFDRLSPQKRASATERQHQVQLARQRGEDHIGQYNPQDHAHKKFGKTLDI